MEGMTSHLIKMVDIFAIDNYELKLNNPYCLKKRRLLI